MKNINTIKIRIEYNEKLISKKKIITNCLSIFKSSNTPQNINEVSVNGTFYLYFQILNLSVVSYSLQYRNLYLHIIQK